MDVIGGMMLSKSDIRKVAKEKRDALSEETRAEKSARITMALLSLKEYDSADAVCAFCSFGTEVSTESFIRTVLKDKKVLFCPRVLDVQASRMEFFRVFSPETDLAPGRMGIPEPHREADTLPEWINNVSQTGRHPQILFLMPGLAFDDTLSRIGYGGGFYDAYLDQMRRMKNADVNTVAVAFSCQLFQETFPVAEHDIRPQMLITK